MDTLTDTLCRPLRDLRVSLIDACNLRCRYCMPTEQFSPDHRFLRPAERLSDEEVLRFIRIFVECGVSKIRLTGGEPLLRPGVAQLIGRIREIPGITDIALTTNGVHLAKFAAALREAGVDRLTISLDAVNRATLARLAGRAVDPKAILDGAIAARDVGFQQTKINMVAMRGWNEDHILPLAELGREHDFIVRFIEYMDVGTMNQWQREDVIPAREIHDLIHERYPLEPADPLYRGEVARRYRYLDGGGEIGLISSVTEPFCHECSRARISADGFLFTCLFGTSGLDLRTLMLAGADDSELRKTVESHWQARTDRYSADRLQLKGQTTGKVEMYHIGG